MPKMMAFQATICGMWRTASMKPILSRTDAEHAQREWCRCTISSASLPQAVTRPRSEIDAAQRQVHAVAPEIDDDGEERPHVDHDSVSTP